MEIISRSKDVLNGLEKLIHIGLAALFPVHCSACDRGDVILCEQCADKLKPLADGGEDNWFGIFSYRDETVRKLIWHFKYRGVIAAAEFFAPYLKDRILSLVEDDWALADYINHQPIILVPVPVPANRTRYRIGRPTVWLAETISRDCGYLICRSDLVIKTRKTKTQMACRSRAERLVNLKDAFAVTDREAARGKTFIIIDDVITTGATMREIETVLLAAGAARVFGLAIARS